MRALRPIAQALFTAAALGALALPALARTPWVFPPQGLVADLPLVLTQTTEPGYNQGGSQTSDTGSGSGYSDRDPEQPPLDPNWPADAQGITPEGTKKLVREISDSVRYCKDRYERWYVTDCVAQAYKRIGATLPWRGGYGAARNALLQGGEALSQLVVANADPARPARQGRTGRRAPSTTFTAVANAPAVAEKAAAILEGTQLVLLRSTSGSNERRAAYEQIATAVGSSVVLIRSGRRKRRKAATGAVPA